MLGHVTWSRSRDQNLRSQVSVSVSLVKVSVSVSYKLSRSHHCDLMSRGLSKPSTICNKSKSVLTLVHSYIRFIISI